MNLERTPAAGAEVVQVYLGAPAEGQPPSKPGEYTVYVGKSADNTPHTATLTVR